MYTYIYTYIYIYVHPYTYIYIHPKTLFEIAMVLSTNSSSFPSNSHVSATFSILLRFGESWNPTNFEKFNADGSLVGRTNSTRDASLNFFRWFGSISTESIQTMSLGLYTSECSALKHDFGLFWMI